MVMTIDIEITYYSRKKTFDFYGSIIMLSMNLNWLSTGLISLHISLKVRPIYVERWMELATMPLINDSTSRLTQTEKQ